MRKDQHVRPEESKGRPEKKPEERKRELEELRNRMEQIQIGAKQLQAAVDALLTAVTLEFGRRCKDGEKRLELPGFSAAELNEAYELRAGRGAGGKGYVLTALPRKAGTEGDGTGGEKDRKAE